MVVYRLLVYQQLNVFPINSLGLPMAYPVHVAKLVGLLLDGHSLF
jgi:hypothetical protein